MTFKIYGDNRIEGFWFKDLSDHLKNAQFQSILGRGQNPNFIDKLIEYDRPDIILTRDDRPVLVVEKTREVPTGHNVGQRFARLVKAVEEGVPTIYFFPFDARKHGEYTGICNLNIRLLKAFSKMSEIHSIPILAVNWITDEHGELIDDSSEDETMSQIINDYIDSNLDINCKQFRHHFRLNELEYIERLQRRKSYSKPPNSVEILETSELLSNLGSRVDEITKDALNERSESVVYTMAMTPDKCRREDPYTGTQFIYDYIWCRVGPQVEDKNRNLVLHFPKLSRALWYRLNPNDKTRKSCNWYLTANALVFSDTIDLLRH